MPFFAVYNSGEFDKNANSFWIIDTLFGYAFPEICLATIGVCVFCALASVGALFIFGGIL